MPKISDTSEKVHQAADKLLSQGLRPTQQAVRDLIGTGSITTINHALNSWWQGLSDRLNRQAEHPSLPDPVITAASKLWDQALVYSQASFEQQRQILERELSDKKQTDSVQVSELQQALLLQQQQNNRLLESNEQLSIEKNNLASTVNALESDLIRCSSENNELNRQIKQQDILLKNADSYQLTSNNQSDDLFQAKINLKVNEKLVEDLNASLAKKESECQQLQQTLFEQEKSSIKQVHRLELVISQQDAKYNEVKSQLDRALEDK